MAYDPAHDYDEPTDTDTSAAAALTPSLDARVGQLLDKAKSLVTGDRAQAYGDALDGFTEVGKLWAVVLGLAEVTPEQVALCLNQLKVARLIHNPSHADSWCDGSGYMALGGGIASAPGRYV